MIKKIVKKIINNKYVRPIINRLFTEKNNLCPLIDLYPKLYLKESLENKRFYNIGGGAFLHPYWTVIDYTSYWYNVAEKGHSFISYNLFSLDKLPIPDNSAEVVYSSHTIEHISNEATQNMFNEAYRILKKNGYLRITTPNIDLGYRAGMENDKAYFYWSDNFSRLEYMKRIKIKIPMDKVSTKQLFLFQFTSVLCEMQAEQSIKKVSDEEIDRIFSTLDYEDALDYFTSKCTVEMQNKYPGNHMNWYNEKKLFKMLKKAGFEKVYRSGYGQSFCPVLRNTFIFDNTHPKISIYVEARK